MLILPHLAISTFVRSIKGGFYAWKRVYLLHYYYSTLLGPAVIPVLLDNSSCNDTVLFGYIIYRVYLNIKKLFCPNVGLLGRSCRDYIANVSPILERY